MEKNAYKKLTSSQSINQSINLLFIAASCSVAELQAVSAHLIPLLNNNSIVFTIIVERICKTSTVRAGQCSWVWKSGLWLPPNYMA